MFDVNDPSTAALRLSDRERDEVVALLSAHVAAGRLSETEAAERVAAARSAVTRGDVAPLFADLPDVEPLAPGAALYGTPPEPSASAGAPTVYADPDPATRAAPAAAPLGSAGSASVTPYSAPDQHGAVPAGGSNTSGPAPRWALVANSITPVGATILFFLTGFGGNFHLAWLWFLAVPIVFTITRTYGGIDDRDRKKRRDRD